MIFIGFKYITREELSYYFPIIINFLENIRSTATLPQTSEPSVYAITSFTPSLFKSIEIALCLMISVNCIVGGYKFLTHHLQINMAHGFLEDMFLKYQHKYEINQ